MSLPRFDLVIFDCDGVLVDSERLVNIVFAEMLNELGYEVTLEEMFENFVGRSMAYCVEKIEARLGHPIPPAFMDDFKARCQIAMERDLKPIRGIEVALAGLTIPYCVASSGDFTKMRMTLGLTGLLPKFETHMYSVVEVKRGKPFPDVFLHAAQAMGAEPSRTVVIEDSPTGIQAGVAAGMTVFGFLGTASESKLKEAGASLVFGDMASLPSLL